MEQRVIQVIHEKCQTQLQEFEVEVEEPFFLNVQKFGLIYANSRKRLEKSRIVFYCPNCRYEVMSHERLMRRFTWTKERYRERS